MSRPTPKSRTLAASAAAGLLALLAAPWLGLQPAGAVTNGVASDNFANAKVLTMPSFSAADDNSDATTEAGEPAPIAGQPAAVSLWYRWKATQSGPVTFSTAGTDFDTVLAAYTGSTLGSLVKKAANDDATIGGVATHQSLITFTATAGTTYSIALDGYNKYTKGQTVLRWTSDDDFSAAETHAGNSFLTFGDNVTATKQAGEPVHEGLGGGHTVWYTWTPQTSGGGTVRTVNTDFDTVLAVYKGTSVGSLTKVAANDNVSSAETTSTVEFPTVAGTTYRIAVDGKAGATGGFLLQASLSAPALDVIGKTSLEGKSGTHVVPFTLSIGSPSQATVVATYATKNGTATAGSDYIATSGSVTFAPGQTTKTVNVTVKGDKTKEANETVDLTIKTLSGAYMDTTSPIVIKNDD